MVASSRWQHEAYGDIQTVATVLLAPVIVFLIGYNVKGLVASGDENAQQLEENMDVNPLAFEDESRISDGEGGDDGD